ncbi:MAG: hypothetical protein K2X59_03030 [Sphingomonas sp.]|nr:hypothetical protein [Sphingomonas sp.]
MSRASDKATAIAKAARDAAIARGVEEIGAVLPDVTVTAIEDGIELKGREIARRLVTDPVLRWIGRLFR